MSGKISVAKWLQLMRRSSVSPTALTSSLRLMFSTICREFCTTVDLNFSCSRWIALSLTVCM